MDWAVAALRRRIASGTKRPVCVDLCCGAGTVALSLAAEVPGAIVHAVEIDAGALAWAQRNVEHHGLDVHLHKADAGDALAKLNGTVDLVASNPPYVATGEIDQVSPEVRDHDPAVALGAGDDGLDIIRIVEESARRLLKGGGVVTVEHSDRQGTSALGVFGDARFWADARAHQDQEQLDRFVTATRR